MKEHPVSRQSAEFFAYPDISGFDIGSVWENAVQLLSRVGIQVTNNRILEAAKGPLLVRDGRVYFPPDQILAGAERIRSRNALAGRAQKMQKMDIFNGGVHCRYFDEQSSEVRPFDRRSLSEYTRFIQQLKSEGRFLGARPLGYPGDVPPEIQYIESGYIDALYNPSPECHGLTASLRAMRYQIEMAELLGVKFQFGTEPISPLRVDGNSIDVVMSLHTPSLRVGVDPMPVMGVTAPLDLHAAWAQSVAENLGTCILLDMCGIPASPSFRLFPPNMITGMCCFSSPLHLTVVLTGRIVRGFFGLPSNTAEFLLVTAKRPDQQAAVEKTAGCIAGGLFGFRNLEGAGALDVDTMFSARQLMIDLEIRDYTRRMMVEVPSAAVDAAAEVTRGVTVGGFLQNDLTLERWAEFTWKPSLFSLGGEYSLPGRLEKVSVSEVAGRYTYELGGERRESLERLMARARKELGT